MRYATDKNRLHRARLMVGLVQPLQPTQRAQTLSHYARTRSGFVQGARGARGRSAGGVLGIAAKDTQVRERRE